MPKLRSCPFCGGEGKVVHIMTCYDSDGNVEKNLYTVRCTQCDNQLKIDKFTGYTSEEMAANAWNEGCVQQEEISDDLRYLRDLLNLYRAIEEDSL